MNNHKCVYIKMGTGTISYLDENLRKLNFTDDDSVFEARYNINSKTE